MPDAAADPYTSGDVFGPARRALWLGPAMIVVGAAIVVFGVSGGGAWTLLAIPGGILALLGLLRLLAGAAVLLVEQRRQRVVREGVSATGLVASSRQLGTRLGYPLLEIEMDVSAEDGRSARLTRKGAVPPQYADEFGVGSEIPLRVDANDLTAFAVDWNAF